MQKTIALLFGGISSEREVSIASADSVFAALDKDKYQIKRYDARDDLKVFINDCLEKKIDLVLPIMHGSFGEDGRLQGMLDMLGVPYVFSGCLASALAMNKRKTKLIAADAGLDTAPDMLLDSREECDVEDVENRLGWPVVIKPNEAGSSVGITVAQDKKELEKGIEEAFKSGKEIILEKYIKGRELTIPLLGVHDPIALPAIEIIPNKSSWYDYRSKYEEGGSDHVCPADISDDIKTLMEDRAKKIFKALGCKDLARADFILNEDDGKLYFLEINTIPGMTKTSLAPESAKVYGLSFSEFLDKLIESASRS
ncbi:D-alanine--D-alanine ligase [Candidatus Falkowbacteria bacterium]|nr:D-alanine--D-alanine ligase [Candidatus Falkowbacteria bacterium]